MGKKKVNLPSEISHFRGSVETAVCSLAKADEGFRSCWSQFVSEGERRSGS